MSMRHGRSIPARTLATLLGMALAWPLAAQTQSQASSAPATFQVNEYLVRGNTLLQSVDIENVVEPYLGPGRSMNDVHAARDALQKFYQSKGYQSVVIEIPPQQVKNGVIVLQVMENSVGRLRVEGAKYHSPQEIRDAVPSLAQGTVPNFNEVQKELTNLNRQPGQQVVPVLSPGSMPQTMDVTLKVNDTDPLHASVEVNNDHSAYTPDLRTVASVSDDNLWQLGHTLSATYIVAPQDPHATSVYALSYLAPLNAQWSLLGSAYKSNSNANTLGGTTVLGKGNAASLQASKQLPVLNGDYTQSVSFGISRKHFDQNITLGGQTLDAPLTYYPVSAAYSGQHTGDKSTTNFTLTGNFGWRGLGSSNQAFDNQRYNARDNFADLHLDFGYVRSFADDFALATRASAQATDSPLISSEQFAAGGMSSVRGYLSAEDTADNGAIASVELRTPSIHAWLGSFADDWRFHVFVDGARLMLVDPLPEQRGRFSLLSTGIGTQFVVFHNLNGDIEYAYPLRNGVQTRAHDGHLLFSVKAGL
ncbi:ShlB/FhaC/HecB family hemolysin secretion/activation protein [Dyella monticola]|uniref:ShlB/FhaC/HecB family hemolysin secretion/activation protein n=1 Tax=Dyella monticola TaxID=1927958 RepID=A0A370WZX5_9GAMM|nr:ShlB/FhaC/HecB family hemolysin secretion/activation protein [Dyella monticola]RDS81718.1 ShlB/FhaC/HecB family hemolysin secretion/activation protein [Dyella monticola]